MIIYNPGTRMVSSKYCHIGNNPYDDVNFNRLSEKQSKVQTQNPIIFSRSKTKTRSVSKNCLDCQYSLHYAKNCNSLSIIPIITLVLIILTNLHPVTNTFIDQNLDLKSATNYSIQSDGSLPLTSLSLQQTIQPPEPYLVMSPKNLTAIDKTTAILICEVRNDNSGRQPKYEWFKDNISLRNKRRTPHMKYKTWSVLRLEPLKIDRDEGVYACAVDLESGKTLRSDINLHIIKQADSQKGFPSISRQPVSQQSVELGGQVSIECGANGDPEPEYSWLHNTFPIEYDNGRITTTSDGSSLTINNVTDSDKGEYLCVVTNSKGYVLSSSSGLTVSLEVTLDNPPTDLKYKLTSPTDVTITWQHPVTKNNVSIIGYEVYFGKLAPANSTKLDMPPETNRVAFNDLSENTEYTFRVRPRFTSGFGSYSKPISIMTPKDSLPPPTNVKALGASYTTAMLWWDEQAYFDGITGYRIYYNLSSNQPSINIDYDRWMVKEVHLTNSVIITNLLRDEFYEARVCVIGSNLSGKLSSPVKFRSAPIEVPYDMKVAEVTTHSVKLVWKPPLDMQPSKYKIIYDVPEKHFIDGQGLARSLSIPPTTINTTNSMIDITDLLPYTKYRINVTAVPFRESFRPPISMYFTTHMAAPKQMLQPTLVGKTNNPGEFEVFLPRASEEFGPIGHYYVIVIPVPQLSEISNLDPDNYLTSDLKSSVRSERNPYIAAKFSKSKVIQKFILGDNKTYEGFKNRELSTDMDYCVFVRAIVEGAESLFTSSPLSDPISLQAKVGTFEINKSISETDRKFKLVIAFALAIVFIAGVAAILFLRNQRQISKTNKINETTIRLLPEREIDRIYSSVPAEPQQLIERRNLTYQSRAMLNHPNIPVNELAEHIEVLKMNNNLKDEYESIEPGQQFTWEHSYSDFNRPKNRYGNVVAYDHSRVMLSPILDANKQPIIGSDYINANYCDGYNNPNQYIATQGPLPNTVGDFWRMVWEQKSRTIVMMTQLEERGRVKCVQFWPSKDSVTYFGITVTGCICSKQCVCVEELAYYTIRTFKIQFGNTIREVKQFQFTAWPDHGVPDHPTPFLMFLRRIKMTNPLDAGPMVVLCSAGVGRTGCYIVIDSMIERVKHDNTIDIYGHVTRLRAQRNYIVQTEDQYMFIHDAVLEAIISADTVVPVALLTEHLQKLLQLSTNDGAITGLESEFKRLTAIKHSNQKFISANLPVNKHKNRLMNILPYESTRVCLEPIAGIDGSDYINASFCDGYTQRNAYIATQSPLPETVKDLWRMVIEHNSGIIVMLTKLKEMGREKCTQYWPAQRYGDYGPYRVTLNQEYNTAFNYVLREFTVTDSRNPNYSRVIRQFHYMDWPEQGVPKSGDAFIQFITDVHNTKQTCGIEGPITVLCSVGVGRTGVFIALSITLERLRNEGFLNLFETVRTLRTQRPGMVQTEDQYQFCYQTALEYIRKF